MSDHEPALETTDKESVTQIRSDNRPVNEITYIMAVNVIRKNIQNAARNRVHIYSFNIPEDTLKKAYALLDKELERRSMKFAEIIPGKNLLADFITLDVVHNATAVAWDHALIFALNKLTATPQPSAPGCFGVGGASIHLGPRQKQADAGIGPTPGKPSVVLEVGDSESLSQLKIDAGLWLEHIPEVQLVFLISIDPPCPAHPAMPRITVQLWKSRAPTRPQHAGSACQREAFMVLEADWSLNATPVYVLLSDVFRAYPVHVAYGGSNGRAILDTAWLRDRIIDSY